MVVQGVIGGNMFRSNRKKSRSIPSILILFILVMTLPSQKIHALTEVVINTNDNGAGSLRQALIDSIPGDTITFDDSLSGAVIYLASTLLIDKNITIDGSSLSSQITLSGDSDNDGSGNVRVFDVNNGVNVLISSISIMKGSSTSGMNSEIGGGGIFNQGSLTIVNCSFIENRADRGAGIFNNGNGTVNVDHSIFLQNSATIDDGGGIANWNGVVTITNSVFSDNVANYAGGAIFSAGPLTSITSSSFTNNSAIYGGGIANWYLSTVEVGNSTLVSNSSLAYGGGLYINSGIGTVNNSTFFNNETQLGGGGVYNFGLLTINNSTLSENVVNGSVSGGGIFNDRTLNLNNTIVASSTGSDCINNLGTLENNTNNLIEDGSCMALIAGDPKLDVLGDNGGNTQTMALLPGSAAIDAGDLTSCLPIDQRGISRPQGVQCDIGAYELQDLTPTVLTFSSNGSYDGDVIEKKTTVGKGGEIDFSSLVFRLGDDKKDQQYRGILSFETSGIPNKAIITSATLKIFQQSVTGNASLGLFQGMIVDISTGPFRNINLQKTDFQAASDSSTGPFTPIANGGWYSVNLDDLVGYINKFSTKSGVTQIRLRFALATNENGTADFISFVSGNSSITPPTLIVEYFIP